MRPPYGLVPASQKKKTKTKKTILIVFLVVCWCAVLAYVANSMDLYQIAPRAQRSDRGSWCFSCHRSLLVQSTLRIH